MVTVTYDDLLLAFDFVCSGGPLEHQAYISLDTGKTFWMSDGQAVEDDEIPTDFEESDRYLEIPHKNDLDLGRELVFRFAEERLPHHRHRIAEIFDRRGAYQRFKDLLARENRLEEWYAFEAEATRQALQQWCEANGIRLVDADATG
jgi:hypothetical protein